MARCPFGWGSLRRATALQIPQRETGIRSPADRGEVRSGCGDLTTINTLVTTGIQGDEREPAGDTTSGFDPVHRAALHTGRDRADARTQTSAGLRRREGGDGGRP